MVTITEVPDDQAFNIPRTAPVVVGVPGGRQSRPAASQPNSQPRKRNYPRHDRILELEGDESSEDEPLGGPRDMSEAEMRRLTEKSGIMRQKPPGEPDVPALFSALFVAIPMALGYAGLKYAVRSQFMVWDDFSIWELVKESVGVYLASLVFVAVTLQYRKSRLMNVLLGIFATVFGCWMVHATEIDRSYGAVSRTPGLAVLWIYTIAQGNLAVDVVSLGLTLAYHLTEGGKSLRSGSTQRAF